MFMQIIPKDFKLGDSEYPEWWKFEIGGDEIVLAAQPLGLDHGQLPITVAAPDFDGYSVTPTSRMEVLYGMQETLDWEVNSHIENIRKAINDMLVVDPMLVNIHDVTNPKPGKVIRLRRQAWGRGVKDSVMQLAVSDVTRGHMADAGYMMDAIKYVSASQDSIAGVRRQTSERVSATEAASTTQGALSRLERMARIISLQAHYDIANQLGHNTRQLMETETYAKIVGENINILQKELGQDINPSRRIAISPKDLDIEFDIIPHDGTTPSSGNADLWLRMWQIMAQNEGLAQQFDMVRMFKYGAKLAGAKNLDDFVKKGGGVQAEVRPDEAVEQGVQQGDLVGAEDYLSNL